MVTRVSLSLLRIGPVGHRRAWRRALRRDMERSGRRVRSAAEASRRTPRRRTAWLLISLTVPNVGCSALSLLSCTPCVRLFVSSFPCFSRRAPPVIPLIVPSLPLFLLLFLSPASSLFTVQLQATVSLGATVKAAAVAAAVVGLLFNHALL